MASSSTFLGHPWTQSPFLSGVHPLFLGELPASPPAKGAHSASFNLPLPELQTQISAPRGDYRPCLAGPSDSPCPRPLPPMDGNPSQLQPAGRGICEPVTPHRMGIIIVLASRVVVRGQRKVLGTAPGREFSVISVFESEEKTPYSTQWGLSLGDCGRQPPRNSPVKPPP